jgi:nucleoside 2-deoxyribosyltransferase
MFYVAHRLFAAHDRQFGAQAAQRLATAVGPDRVFLPFCDTDEEDLIADVKGRRLYELDTERLGRLTGMLAILHGPSLDDGVCMEIGYAAALGVPVVALTTDFQTYGLREDGRPLEFPDPLVQAVVDEVVRVSALGPPAPSSTERFAAFAGRNQDQVRYAIDTAVDRLISHAIHRGQPAGLLRDSKAAWCEASPYQPSEAWEKITNHLVTGGWQIRQPSRFSATNPVAAAYADWATFAQCELLIADVNGPETPPGAALLLGAAAATGRQVIAVQNAPAWTFAPGREPNWRNLMIQYATSMRLADVDDLPRLVG